MAAVLCAARRLGGSLLQRSQAEEGLRLVPNRLMRSRLLSSEASGKNACETEMERELRKLRSEVGKKMDNKQTASNVGVMSYVRTIDGVITDAAKFAFICFMPYSVYFILTNEKRVEAAKALAKENQRRHKIER